MRVALRFWRDDALVARTLWQSSTPGSPLSAHSFHIDESRFGDQTNLHVDRAFINLCDGLKKHRNTENLEKIRGFPKFGTTLT